MPGSALGEFDAVLLLPELPNMISATTAHTAMTPPIQTVPLLALFGHVGAALARRQAVLQAFLGEVVVKHGADSFR